MDQTSIDQSGRLVRVARFPRLRTLAWSGDHLHASPAENPNAIATDLGEYFMLFVEKADYQGFNDRCSSTRLSRHHRSAVQPHRDRTIRPGKLQPVLRHRRHRTPKVLRQCRLAVLAPRAHKDSPSGPTSIENTATLSVPRGARLRLRFPQIFPVSRLKPR